MTYQEALDSVRKEVKSTFFDELGKQWWTTNRDDDYRCNLLQEAIDKANKYDEKETMVEQMTDKLTLDWIISTLKKSGVNSKQIVIDRLEKAHYGELKELINSLVEEITNDKRLPF